MSDNISKLLVDIKVPKMAKIRQKFNPKKIEDVAVEVSKQLDRTEIRSAVKPGDSIAITCGSRGVANIPLVLREIANFLKSLGGKPFIIPAMGSHGGSTAEGQREIIESYGVTEDYVGCPIRSTMEVSLVGHTETGEPVYIDKYACEADGIVVVNRIKAHTSFRGKYESGLMKMITIGLGKQVGADTCHADGFKYMSEKVPMYANVIRKNAKIIFGVATIENAYDETYKIAALTNEEIPEKEPELLLESKTLMPRIKFDEIDVLIIDEMGKEISGAGIDPNITGRYDTPYASGGPTVQRIIVLDLTHKTHGNACGIGLADFTTRRLFDKMDFANTYPNIITNTLPHTVKIPAVMENDDLAIKSAIKTCNFIDKKNPRVVRMKNTLCVEELYISEVLLEEARKDKTIEILEEPKHLNFDENGNLF